MRKIIFTILTLTLAAAFAGPYDTWTNYRDVTVNTTAAAVSGSVANFPLLVRLTNTSDAAGANVLSGSLSAGGADVRFTDASGNTALNYEIETWSSTSAAIWVLVPNVAGSANTVIRLYWGKSGQTSLSNGPAVFDTVTTGLSGGFRSVWHMGNASGQNPRPNSTVYSALPATPRNYAVGFNPAIPGIVGFADTLPGGIQGSSTGGVNSGPYYMIDSGTATDAYNFSGGKLTVSFWALSNRFVANRRHFHFQNNPVSGVANPAGAIQTIPSTQTPSANMYFRYSTAPGTTTGAYQGSNTGGANLVLNTWQHITCVVSRGPTLDTLYKYYNGVLNSAGTVTTANLLPDVPRTYAFLGRAFESTSDSVFGGNLDEIQFSNVSRSPDWIKLNYQTQRPDSASTFVALGTTMTTASVPGAPTIGTATAGNAQATVTWTAPSSDGGSAITGYTARAVTDTSKKCTTTGGLTCTVTGLTNGTAYTFTVTATNAAGTGTASAASNSVTPVAPPGVPGPPTGVTGVAGNAQVAVTWVAPSSDGGSPITGYTATSSPDGKTCTTTGALTCTVTTLTNGTAYTFAVVATNTSGSSAASIASASVTPVGAPGAPTAVAGVAGNAQVAVTWVAPASTGGSTITGYTVTSTPESKTCTTTGALTCTVTALTNGTAYTFTATATNTAGTSAASTASAAVTPRTVPGAPTNVTGVASAGQVAVSWVAPTSNGGSAITGYTATSTPGSFTCTTTGALTCNVTGLAAGTTYTFTVTATNVAGTSAASTASPGVPVGILAFAKSGFSIRQTGAAVSFQIPKGLSDVRILVMDLQGRPVWDRAVTPKGALQFSWDGATANGHRVAPGLYLVRVTASDAEQNPRTLVETKINYTP